MPIRVGVLGPLEVVWEGRQVEVRGAKERALLVHLALEAGRAVSSDRLIDSLWDGDPPATAEASLRVLVSRVRKALVGAGAVDVIRTRPAGYVLTADVDAAEFELLCARARAESARHQPEQAAATAAQALALWRGDRLAEAAAGRLRAQAARLEETRLAALELRIAADLAAGRHAGVVAELEALCHAQPLREGLWALLITALYRCDRQADALAAYRDVRRVLAEDLGLDPSPRLQRLERAVLTHDPALASPAHPSAGQPATVLPPPPSVAGDERVALVGRTAEMEAARAAWDAVRAGGSGVVLLSGEAGIGKSRLLRELARWAHVQGAAVLYGRCDEDLAIPFRPFVEGLSHAVAHVADPVLASIAPRWLAEVGRLIPGLGARRPELPAPAVADAEVERHLLFGGIAALLEGLARRGPVVVIVDDLHWSDRPTLALLRHLAGLRLRRLLLAGAFRGGENVGGPLVETLGALHREAQVTRIDAGALHDEEVVQLISAATGRTADEAGVRLAGALRRETGGNPFFLVELLSHLRETGVITVLPGGRWTGVGAPGAELPHGIRDVLRARVARLGPTAARVLSDAAVIGLEFDLDLLAATTGADVDRVLDLLESAQRVALVAEAGLPEGRFHFAHGLVQQTLYGDLGPSRRTRAHARVAAAMERLGGREPGELAFHFLAGLTPATLDRAIHHARAAGAQALETSAPDEACRWYSAALSALPPPREDAEHARALIDLATAQRLAGRPAHRETLLAAAAIARRVGRDDLLIQAALASNRGSFSRLGEVDAEVTGVLEAALAVAPAESPERARLLAVLAAELSWHPDHLRRVALADDAVATARSTGDSAALRFAILRPGPARWIPETSERRVRLYREALTLAQGAGDRLGASQATLLLVPSLLERGSADTCDGDLEAAAEVAAEVGEPFGRWISLFVRGCMAIAHGRLDRAEADAAAALEVARAGGLPEGERAYDEQLFMVRWQQGRLSEILARFCEVGGLLPVITTRQAELALAEALHGDRERARALLREAAGAGFASFYGAPWLGCMTLWADVAAELGETGAGDMLHRLLAPWEDLFATGGPLPVHAVALALGRLAAARHDPGAADRHFAVAMRVHEAVRSPFGIAETALHWGSLLADGEPGRARRLLARAAEVADRHGFTDVALRAGEVIAAC